jgi:Na+-transporting methylmalonyl-CoA/oxaloacetate decarboxylase gamma subunit
MLFSTTVIWANTTADSAYVFFDFARISAPIHGNEHLNGWVVTGMGMFIAFSCLLLIMFVVKYLPYALKLLDYIVPEKIVEEARKIQSINTETNEAIAAAVAVAYHNHNNDGR